MELKEVVQKLLVYAKPHWKLFGGAFLFFTLGAAVEPAIPALFISYTQPHAKTLRRKQKLLVLHPMFDACGKGTKMGF